MGLRLGWGLWQRGCFRRSGAAGAFRMSDGQDGRAGLEPVACWLRALDGGACSVPGFLCEGNATSRLVQRVVSISCLLFGSALVRL